MHQFCSLIFFFSSQRKNILSNPLKNPPNLEWKMQPEARQEKPLHEFTGCRSSAAARDSRQPITHTSKGTFCPARVAGTCLLILNRFFLSQDLESYVTIALC